MARKTKLNRIEVTPILQEQLKNVCKIDQIKKVSIKENGGKFKYVPKWEDRLSEESLNFIFSKGNVLNITEDKNSFTFPKKYAVNIKPIVKTLFPEMFLHVTGHYYYPKTGYLGWHTNYASPNDRVYVTYSTGNSFFRYYDGEKVVTDYDDCGFTIRRFSILNKKPYFWHCVGSDCDRFSFGFKLKNGYKLKN